MCYTAAKTEISGLFSPVLKETTKWISNFRRIGNIFIVFKWLLFRLSIFDIGGAWIARKTMNVEIGRQVG